MQVAAFLVKTFSILICGLSLSGCASVRYEKGDIPDLLFAIILPSLIFLVVFFWRKLLKKGEDIERKRFYGFNSYEEVKIDFLDRQTRFGYTLLIFCLLGCIG